MSHNTHKTKCLNTLTVIPSSSNNYISLKADSGSRKTYIRPQNKEILHQQQMIKDSPQIKILNRMSMHAIQSGILPLHEFLSKEAKQASVLEGLSNTSLLSIRQLCDDDCIVIFDKKNMHVFKKGQCIMRGI